MECRLSARSTLKKVKAVAVREIKQGMDGWDDGMHRVCWDENRGVARLHQRQTSETAAGCPRADGRVNQTQMRARTCAHTRVYLTKCTLAD